MCNTGYRQFATDQFDCGAVQPKPAYCFSYSLPTRGTIDPVKVIPGQTGDIRQTSQIDGVVRMIGQPLKHPLETSPVVLHRCVSVHGRYRNETDLI